MIGERDVMVVDDLHLDHWAGPGPRSVRGSRLAAPGPLRRRRLMRWTWRAICRTCQRWVG